MLESSIHYDVSKSCNSAPDNCAWAAQALHCISHSARVISGYLLSLSFCSRYIRFFDQTKKMHSKFLVLGALPILAMARAYPPVLRGRQDPDTTTSIETSRPTSPTHTWTAAGDASATGPWDGHYTGIYTGTLPDDDSGHYTGIYSATATGCTGICTGTPTAAYTGIYTPTGSATGSATGCTGICTGTPTAAYTGIYTGELPTTTGQIASNGTSTSAPVVIGGAGKGVQGASWVGGIMAGFAVMGLAL
ncbi:Putative protein of unknown function [Podospora comata]|uniref:Uncharacterized protein n=1 Tax=Podospora comata TaxID=48703 RepID=A0ABY6SBK8_PODCO|nr:Putative protein of unknown function [Podospora comata]